MKRPLAVIYQRCDGFLVPAEVRPVVELVQASGAMVRSGAVCGTGCEDELRVILCPSGPAVRPVGRGTLQCVPARPGLSAACNEWSSAPADSWSQEKAATVRVAAEDDRGVGR